MNILKGGIAGGVVLFIYMAVSWMAIPWHDASVREFKNAKEVAAELTENAKEPGIYIWPHGASADTSSGKKPFIFLSIDYYTGEPMGALNFIIGLGIQIVSAMLVCALMAIGSVTSYFKIVSFATLYGLTSGIATKLPMWNWMRWPIDFVAVDIADLIIGWFLAGLVIAYFVSKPTSEQAQ